MNSDCAEFLIFYKRNGLNCVFVNLLDKIYRILWIQRVSLKKFLHILLSLSNSFQYQIESIQFC